MIYDLDDLKNTLLEINLSKEERHLIESTLDVAYTMGKVDQAKISMDIITETFKYD